MYRIWSIGAVCVLLLPSPGLVTNAAEIGLGQAGTFSQDFNGDGYEDLAISAPYEDASGAVSVVYGAAQGDSLTSQMLRASDQPEEGEAVGRFGHALTTGDFNGDGFDDLAVGAPSADAQASDSGRVFIFSGSPQGFAEIRTTSLDLGSVGVRPAAQEAAEFGYSMTSGDFGRGVAADLAIAALTDISDKESAGAVVILYGAAAGPDVTDPQILSKAVSGVPGRPRSLDHFGLALTSADFGRGAQEDLAVGSYYADGLPALSGSVTLFYGSDAGLASKEVEAFTTKGMGPGPGPHRLAQFGTVLDAGDFDGDHRTDLVAAAPGERVAGRRLAGSVYILRGNASGITRDGVRRWSQNSPGVKDSAEREDIFGFHVAAGNFGRSSHDDLAVASYEDLRNCRDAGAVNVIYGTNGGLSQSSNERLTSRPRGCGELFGSSLGELTPADEPFAGLVVGVPLATIGASREAGRVELFQGGVEGLEGSSQGMTQGGALPDTPEPGDHFGYSLR